MEALKILQRQFEQAAIQFVGMYNKFSWRGKKNDYSLIPYEITFKHELELKRELKTKPEWDWTLDDWGLRLPSVLPTAFGRSYENKKDSQYVPDVPKPICLRQWPYGLDKYNENDRIWFFLHNPPDTQ